MHALGPARKPARARGRSVSFLHGPLWPHRRWLLRRDDRPQTQKRRARCQQGRGVTSEWTHLNPPFALMTPLIVPRGSASRHAFVVADLVDAVRRPWFSGTRFVTAVRWPSACHYRS